MRLAILSALVLAAAAAGQSADVRIYQGTNGRPATVPAPAAYATPIPAAAATVPAAPVYAGTAAVGADRVNQRAVGTIVERTVTPAARIAYQVYQDAAYTQYDLVPAAAGGAYCPPASAGLSLGGNFGGADLGRSAGANRTGYDLGRREVIDYELGDLRTAPRRVQPPAPTTFLGIPQARPGRVVKFIDRPAFGWRGRRG